MTPERVWLADGLFVLLVPVQVGTMKPLDSTTTLQCKAGYLTVAQLYELGWKVVSVFSQATVDPAKPMAGGFLWTVLVETD